MDQVRRHVSMSELRQNTEGVIREVRKRGEPVVITRYGKPVAVLMSVELYTRYVDVAERLRAAARRMVEQEL